MRRVRRGLGDVPTSNYFFANAAPALTSSALAAGLTAAAGPVSIPFAAAKLVDYFNPRTPENSADIAFQQAPSPETAERLLNVWSDRSRYMPETYGLRDASGNPVWKSEDLLALATSGRDAYNQYNSRLGPVIRQLGQIAYYLYNPPSAPASVAASSSVGASVPGGVSPVDTGIPSYPGGAGQPVPPQSPGYPVNYPSGGVSMPRPLGFNVVPYSGGGWDESSPIATSGGSSGGLDFGSIIRSVGSIFKSSGGTQPVSNYQYAPQQAEIPWWVYLAAGVIIGRMSKRGR